MASVSVFFILCAASLRKTGSQRQLFSASSRPLVPLLTMYASLSCGQDRGTTIYYNYGLGALYPRVPPWKVKGLGKKAVPKALPLPVGSDTKTWVGRSSRALVA